jgi:hypothetical protein
VVFLQFFHFISQSVSVLLLMTVVLTLLSRAAASFLSIALPRVPEKCSRSFSVFFHYRCCQGWLCPMCASYVSARATRVLLRARLSDAVRNRVLSSLSRACRGGTFCCSADSGVFDNVAVHACDASVQHDAATAGLLRSSRRSSESRATCCTRHIHMLHNVVVVVVL